MNAEAPQMGIDPVLRGSHWLLWDRIASYKTAGRGAIQGVHSLLGNENQSERSGPSLYNI